MATGGMPPPPPAKPVELPPRGDGLMREEERTESVVACRCKEWKLPEAPITRYVRLSDIHLGLQQDPQTFYCFSSFEHGVAFPFWQCRSKRLCETFEPNAMLIYSLQIPTNPYSEFESAVHLCCLSNAKLFYGKDMQPELKRSNKWH